MSGLLSGPDQSRMLKWDVYCEHSLQVSDRKWPLGPEEVRQGENTMPRSPREET